jgi:hypothetical protein
VCVCVEEVFVYVCVCVTEDFLSCLSSEGIILCSNFEGKSSIYALFFKYLLFIISVTITFELFLRFIVCVCGGVGGVGRMLECLCESYVVFRLFYSSDLRKEPATTTTKNCSLINW